MPEQLVACLLSSHPSPGRLESKNWNKISSSEGYSRSKAKPEGISALKVFD